MFQKLLTLLRRPAVRPGFHSDGGGLVYRPGTVLCEPHLDHARGLPAVLDLYGGGR